jgi:hypothetical protein
VNGFSASFNSSSVEVLSATYVSAGQVNLTVRVVSDAAPGVYTLTVTNPDNGTGTATFEVLATTNPPNLSGEEFDGFSYDSFETLGISMPVSATPTITFNFNAPETVSTEGFRIYVSQEGSALITYDKDDYTSSAWSGSTTSGTFTFTIPTAMNPGLAVVTLYGQDIRGAGASTVCNLSIPDPSTHTGRIVGDVLPYPSPWDPRAGQVTFQFELDNDLNKTAYFNILGPDGRVIHRETLVNLLAGYHKLTWDGIGAFSERISTGIYMLPIVDSDGNLLGSGKLVVYYP